MSMSHIYAAVQAITDELPIDVIAKMDSHAGTDFALTKVIEVLAFSEYDSKKWTLAEFKDEIENIAASIPDEYRGAVTVALECGYEGGCCLQATYRRDETENEAVARVNNLLSLVVHNARDEWRRYERLAARLNGDLPRQHE